MRKSKHMEPWSHDFTNQLHPPPAVWSWATDLILVNASSLYERMERIVTKVNVRIKGEKNKQTKNIYSAYVKCLHITSNQLLVLIFHQCCSVGGLKKRGINQSRSTERATLTLSQYLRRQTLQHWPAMCTGRESGEQLSGGQDILRHSTAPLWGRKGRKRHLSRGDLSRTKLTFHPRNFTRKTEVVWGVPGAAQVTLVLKSPPDKARDPRDAASIPVGKIPEEGMATHSTNNFLQPI